MQLEAISICKYICLLQRKSKMGRHYGRTVWARGQEHHPLRGKANFQPSVDSLNRGSGNGKRNRINSKLPHCVSIFLIIINIKKCETID